jgi:hypothetical protein
LEVGGILEGFLEVALDAGVDGEGEEDVEGGVGDGAEDEGGPGGVVVD